MPYSDILNNLTFLPSPQSFIITRNWRLVGKCDASIPYSQVILYIIMHGHSPTLKFKKIQKVYIFQTPEHQTKQAHISCGLQL